MCARKKSDKTYMSDIHIEQIFTPDLIDVGINCQYFPLSDVIETEDYYIIELELPGVFKDNVVVEVTQNMVTVYGIKEKNDDKEHKKYQCMGRVYGKFNRSFKLPGPFNMHGVKAKMEKGILTIHIPKLEEKRNKKIIIPVE